MDAQWAAESNLPRILAVTGTIHVLALILVGLRVYARVSFLRSPGRDDAAIVIASILALGGWICFVLQGYHGLGRHSEAVSKQDRIAFEKISFFQATISAIGALGMLKISIALFLLRLSQNKWYSRSLWALIGFVIIYSIGAWLTFFLRCRPMAAFWNPGLGGTCYSMELFKSVAMANTGFNIATDILSASLPIPIVWCLQMSQRTRMYIIGILSLGYLAVAMGITKTVYQLTLVTNKDRTFESSVQFWGFMQLNVGIIAATIPTLRPLLKKSGPTISDRYNQFDANNRLANGTIGSGLTPRSRKIDSLWTYTRPERVDFEMINVPRDAVATTNIYSTRDKRSCSEEYILARDRDAKGIRCTTKVVVRKSNDEAINRM